MDNKEFKQLCALKTMEILLVKIPTGNDEEIAGWSWHLAEKMGELDKKDSMEEKLRRNKA